MPPDNLQVYLDSMTRYASVALDLSERLYEARRLLVAADVTADSFGMLPDSREVAEAYTQRCTDGLGVLQDGERVFSEIGTAVRQMRDNYAAADEAGASLMEGLG